MRPEIFTTKKLESAMPMRELRNPCYIDGRMIWEEDSSPVTAECEAIRVRQTLASDWMTEAAIETATRTHVALRDFPIGKLFRVLKLTADYYFSEDESYRIVVHLTGCSETYARASIESIKSWMRNIDDFYRSCFPEDRSLVRPTKPIIAILPSNSEEEAAYIMVQTLLSRNSAVVRPSMKCAGSYASLEFVRALNSSIDEMGDPDCDVLRSAISVINLPANGYLPKLAVDGWNYLAFGEDETQHIIRRKLEECHALPRKLIAFGTGFSSTVVMNDLDFDYVPEIADSISVNRGNECLSTDVIYVHKDVAEAFSVALKSQISRLKSRNPFHPESIGVVSTPDIEFIKDQVNLRGKLSELELESDHCGEYMHTTKLDLHEYESAIEYPGPIVSVRVFADLHDLGKLVGQDLSYNKKARSLVTSVFTEYRFDEVLPMISSYTVKHNVGSHVFDPMSPHQGIVLLKEFVDQVRVQGTDLPKLYLQPHDSIEAGRDHPNPKHWVALTQAGA